MQNVLQLHTIKWLALGLTVPFCITLSVLVGEPKPWQAIDWLDVFGEGGGALMVLGWLLLILGSRPAGSVSNIIFVGLALIFIALWQDTMDEFVTIPDAQLWDTWLESGLMPIGMGVFTLGLYRWHQEQLILMEHMAKRERFLRDYRSIDQLTRLANDDYLIRQLDAELRRAHREGYPVSLVLLDIDDFDRVNRRYGVSEGDRLLNAVTELLLLNLRQSDLLCRYGGDRFAITLPHTDEAMAKMLADELTNAISHFAYKSHWLGARISITASAGLAVALSESAGDLVNRANKALNRAKKRARDSRASAA